MLKENFFAAIQSTPKSSSNPSNDPGIYIYELQPESALRSTFKNSSTQVNALSTSSTHIFAAQYEKAVVHVYSREKGNQESIVSFPARINTLKIVGDEFLALGTVEGRLVLWELSTGRMVSTRSAHLQAVTCIAATKSDLISGSEDSKLYVWSVPNLLSTSLSMEYKEPLRCLSNHKASITNITLGHSKSNTNICVSASEENAVLVWNYNSGQLLRTFLLSKTPLCLALDPCDRCVYVGLDDGSIQLIQFVHSDSTKHSLYDINLQATPVKVSSVPWRAPDNDIGPVLCLDVTYDSTCVLSGHKSGEINQWDTGRCRFLHKIADLTAPVTNIILESPFHTSKRTKLATVTKPKVIEHNSIATTRFIGSVSSDFDNVVFAQGFPQDMLQNAIINFTNSSVIPSGEDEQLKKENEDLWRLVNEQRAVQKKTWESYISLRSRDT